MGIVTFGEFRADVDSALGSKGFSLSTLGRWVNYGYLDLAGSVDFEATDTDQTINTTSGVSFVTVPAEATAVKLVKNSSADVLLEWLPKAEFFRRLSVTTGPPTHWTRHGSRIYLHPRPNGVIPLFVVFKRPPAPLVNSSDVTVFPSVWDPAVFMLATHHGMLATGDEVRASAWLARAMNYISSRITESDVGKTFRGLETAVSLGGSEKGLVPDGIHDV